MFVFHFYFLIRKSKYQNIIGQRFPPQRANPHNHSIKRKTYSLINVFLNIWRLVFSPVMPCKTGIPPCFWRGVGHLGITSPCGARLSRVTLLQLIDFFLWLIKRKRCFDSKPKHQTTPGYLLF